MPQAHVVLLANFYGSYLVKEKFSATVIVNNAGIEQLATLGVEKIKEIKKVKHASDDIYVLIIAGLTDVLIKSVEEGKNKLEITPNSTQLIETKMQWSQRLLNAEGAKVIWAVMPPISLRMYHQSEGWNLGSIPSMSKGLDKEQRLLNNLMLDYRTLCLKLNTKDGRTMIPTPFFTDIVSELSSNRSSMHLNTSFFENDGISPTTKLIGNWKRQVEKIVSAIDQITNKPPPPASNAPPLLSIDGVRKEDPWALPAPKREIARRNDRPGPVRPGPAKRGYDDGIPQPARGGLRPIDRHDDVQDYGMGMRRDIGREIDRDRRVSDMEYNRHEKRLRDYSPTPPSVPRLLDMKPRATTGRRSADSAMSNMVNARPGDQQTPDQMAAAMQLLAATVQLSGGNPANVQNVFSALMSQQKHGPRDMEILKRQEEEHIMKKRIEEERLRARQRNIEEAREIEGRKRFEEEKRQEFILKEEMRRKDELRRREEERIRVEEQIRKEELRLEMIRHEEERKHRQQCELQMQQRQREETRLREIQIAAKLAMEQQKIQEERNRQALIREQQAQIALMAVTKRVREQMDANKVTTTAPKVPSLLGIGSSQPVASSKQPSTSALDRINEKLKIEKIKNDAKIDKRISSDEAWQSPVVLFSFVNRANERKPLRGVVGPKLGKGLKALSDYKSRGQLVYGQSLSAVTALGYLKIRVRRPGALTEFENKVANFNNRIYDMLDECDSLVMEGRSQNYVLRRQLDGVKLSYGTGNKGSSAVVSTSDVSDTKNEVSTTSIRSVMAKSDRVGKDSSAKSDDSDQRGRLGNPAVKDLRESLRRPRARSRTPGDYKQKGRSLPTPSATESKPRWDKSDESEDELLWDDDEVASTKLVIDDDDNKSSKGDLFGNDVGMLYVNPDIFTASREKCVDEMANDVTSSRQSHLMEAGDAVIGNARMNEYGDKANINRPMEPVQNNAEEFVTIDEAA